MSWNAVRLDQVTAQPWRNGGGLTRELLAWPGGEDWRLRLSVAQVTQDGPFSQFGGVQRWFSVLCNLVLLGVCGTVVIFGAPIVWKLYEFGQTSDAAEIKVFIPQMVVPLGLAAAAILLLLRVRQWGKDFDAPTSHGTEES